MVPILVELELIMPDDDGLHYTTKTYKRIFKYCLDYLILH